MTIISTIKLCFSIVILGLILSCSKSGSIVNELNGQRYDIPKKNLLEFRSSNLTKSFMKAFEDSTVDSANEIALYFDANELEEEIDDYVITAVGHDDTIETSLRPIIRSSDIKQSYESGWSLSDFLTANDLLDDDKKSLDSYETLPDPDLEGFFRFYYQRHKKSWLLVNARPEEEQAVVVADCRKLEIRNEIKNFSCSRLYRSRSLRIDYRLYGQNYRLIEKVDRFILAKLESWKMTN